ncbi:MAG TPA: VOC family protein [Tepidisphaeraceae bacterium]|jgi:catechol 2,3-dioxygenase-like lactoylglutathione lyase family enzyme
MFLAVDHPAIASYDVEGLAEWYCRNLGMQVIASNGQTPPAMVLGYANSISVDGGAVIELMPANDPGPRPETFTRFQPGIRHIALRVSDFDAAYESLKALGVRFSTEVGEALGGGKTVLFRDPEGNELQIVQRK